MTELLTDIVNAVPWWVRLLLAIAFCVAGGLVLYYVSFRIGVALLGVGFVFLMFSGKSDSEKKGYHF